MEPKELIEKAKGQLEELTGFTSSAGIGLRKREKGGWIITVEIVEKKSIPEGMDVLGLYEVHLNDRGSIESYERKELRKRSDTGTCSREE